jgi:hypothetical protein
MLLSILLTGCSQPAASPDTGAKEATQTFFDSIIRQDWAEAYAALHPDNRKRWTREQFAALARRYRNDFRFEPQKVHIRSCEEQDTEALAHVVLTGRKPSQRFQEGLMLRRGADRWSVVLPDTFGRPRPERP